MDTIAHFWWLWLGIAALLTLFPRKIRILSKFHSILVTVCTFLFLISAVVLFNNYLSTP